jgi:hypoxanthine phosphoribosyltransferase
MKVKDLEFVEFIHSDEIQKRVEALAIELNSDYKGKTPLFLPILNGSFIFAADLIRRINLECKVSFVKHSSYQGTASTGQLKTLIGLNESLFNQDIILVEDIMDTGLTLSKVAEELGSLGTKSVEIVTLIRKSEARTHAVQPKYVGFDIENEFVLGYGLDYEGFGRNLSGIYKAIASQ